VVGSRPGLLAAVPVVALVGALVVLAPLASASPIFAAAAPYSVFGGLPYVGSFVFFAVGSGSNSVVLLPTFAVSTGIAHQSQSSTSSGAALHKLELWSGVQNVCFRCTGTCFTGNYTLQALWNVTSDISLATNCTATASHPAPFSSANISLLAFVEDTSTSPHSTVGQGTRTITHHSLLGAGVLGSRVTHLRVLALNVRLTSGHLYTITAFIQAKTLASSVAGCSASSSVLIGSVIGTSSHPTSLIDLVVG
jgi:hypothetical protein